MKRRVFAIASAILATGALSALGPAAAADLPTRKGPPAPPPPSAYNWTGFYLGLNAGYARGSGDANLQVPGVAAAAFAPPINAGSFPTSVGFNRSGFIGGGQIGYNYQISALVLGVEADLDGAHVSGSSTIRTAVLPKFAPGVFSAGSTLNWLGTVRARLGFTPIDRWLVYATGGLAYGADQHSYLASYPMDAQTLTSSRTLVRAGWTLGAGLEWAFADNWSVKAEYLHYNLGSSSDVATPSAALAPFLFGAKISNKFSDDSGDIARFGVNYKFF
jgi:outer membrane immunogenic protein